MDRAGTSPQNSARLITAWQTRVAGVETSGRPVTLVAWMVCSEIPIPVRGAKHEQSKRYEKRHEEKAHQEPEGKARSKAREKSE